MATLQGCCFVSRAITASHDFRPLHLSGGLGRRRVAVSLSEKKEDCRVSHALLDLGRRRRKSLHLCHGAADPAPEAAMPESNSSSVPAPATEEESPKSVWQKWQKTTAELRAKVSKWGLAAVLAYGLFDGITYTTFFVLAFLSYEQSTGKNPATNLKALLGVVVLMWGGNNVTRPFRVAGAAALAPFIDRGLKKMQEVLKLPNQAFAFMICVATFACACFSVVAVLILSRLGR